MILVIDDDDELADILALVLAQAGHAVQYACSAEKGLALALAARPELILLDWQIPKVNGAEILSSLQSSPQLKTIPVLLMSGNLDAIPAAQLNAHFHLAKPFGADQLTALVTRILQPSAG